MTFETQLAPIVVPAVLNAITAGDAEPASALARILLRKKGFDGDAIQSVDAHAFKEQQYNQLADALRTHLDLKKIYAILEQGLSEGGEADV